MKLIRLLLILLGGSIFALLLTVLAYVCWLDIFRPEGGRYGSGDFASEAELRTVLKRCGITSPKIDRAGILIERGLGWDATGEHPQVPDRLGCIDKRLREIGRTAGVIGEWD